MKFIRAVCFLTLLFLSGHQSSFACQCYTAPPPCHNYWKYGAVFVGTVESVQNETQSFQPLVEVKVEQNFRGINGQTAYTYNASTSCSFRFRKGDKLLFYGNLDDEKKDYFYTGFCTRTQGFEENLSDFDFFKSLNSETPNYWVWGTVSKGSLNTPLKGIKAEAFNKKNFYSGTSDENGDIKIVVPNEGKYKVRVYAPKGAGFGTSQWEEQRNVLKSEGFYKKKHYLEYEVEVKNNHCGWFDTVLFGLKN